MTFKFQILDLFVLTTWAASMAAAFQADLILFRQLLCISLVAICSTSSVLLFSKTKHKVQFVGGAGGVTGGLIYLAIAFVFAHFLYEHRSFTSLPTGHQMWIKDVPVALVLAVLFGATIGPLFSLRFQDHKLANEHRKIFWFSVVLLTGIFLLGVFAMFDRRTMQGRDWFVVSLVLSIVFVINTNELLVRIKARRASQDESRTCVSPKLK